MLRIGGLLGILLGLVACVSSNPGPTLLPSAPLPDIATTPSLQAWTTERILSFREAEGSEPIVEFGLQVLALPAATDAAISEDLLLVVSTAEPPPEWFVTLLGQERIAIVVHPDNRVRDLTLKQIAQAFSGRVQNWEILGGTSTVVQPVIPLEGSELREYLEEGLLANQQFTPNALLAPTPAATLELVGDNRGAIGVLPLSALSDEAVALRIDGEAPSESEVYPLVLEVLGWAPEEPEGAVRDWLAWLQAAMP